MEESDRDLPGWTFWLITWIAGCVALLVMLGVGFGPAGGFEILLRAHAGPLAGFFLPAAARGDALVAMGLALVLAPLATAHLWRRTRTAALVSAIGTLVWLVLGVLSQARAWTV